ncbi:hypothetical protein G6F22_021706 [Rhizopus arrhizus]|nr:hypothetical protein G6F22_021706 [Rhizopus arrhizus]
MDCGPPQTADCAPFEESIELQLAVPKSLGILAGGSVGLHYGVVSRIVVDGAVVCVVVRGIAHGMDRRTRGDQNTGNVGS